MDYVIIGTLLKILVNIEPISNNHMSNLDFTCFFYTSTQNKVEIKKLQMLKQDDDNYIATIDSKDLGCGTIFVEVLVLVPDSDFPNLYRKEIGIASTGININV